MKFNLQSELALAKLSVEGRTSKKALLAKLNAGLEEQRAQRIITRMYNAAVKEIVYREAK